MKTRFILVILFLCQLVFGQDATYKNELIELAKIYRNFHFRNTPPQDVFNQLNKISSTNLLTSKDFISELIKTNNSISTKKYLTKPDSVTLKSLYIIRGINWNMHEADPKDNLIVIDSLLNEHTDYFELLSCYYGMVFTAVGNKNRPFDMSTVNFTLWDYDLENDTEKGIFFLESMETFGTLIWGYMNIPKPPNYKKALDYINKYPKYNGQPYYQYLDLNFQDFKVTTDKRKPKDSFKKYYLNKYMNTILYHSMCLSQKKKYKEQRYDLLLGSIIKNESYWQYSETPEIFEQIFKKVKE
jgi:hypothetical protein